MVWTNVTNILSQSNNSVTRCTERVSQPTLFTLNYLNRHVSQIELYIIIYNTAEAESRNEQLETRENKIRDSLRLLNCSLITLLRVSNNLHTARVYPVSWHEVWNIYYLYSYDTVITTAIMLTECALNAHWVAKLTAPCFFPTI